MKFSFKIKKPRKKPVQREKMLQNAIADFLEINGVFAWVTWQPYIHKKKGHFFQNWHRSSSGVADILGIYNGKPLAIEVKTKKTKPSHNQENFLKRFSENGGITFVVRSINDVIENLERIKNGRN